jgi:NADP-dependent 3-hydroxy acid dehydrogenase YdfG
MAFAVIEPRSTDHSGLVMNCVRFFIRPTHSLGHRVFPLVSVVTPVLRHGFHFPVITCTDAPPVVTPDCFRTLAQEAVVGLKGRVAIVTDGGRGIGPAIGEALARDGAIVAVNYRKDAVAAEATLAAIAGAGGQARIYRASVDSFEGCRTMVDTIVAEFGGVDILVNNAGIASRGHSVHDTDPAEMERVVRTHAFGAFNMSKLVLPSMRTRGRGDIVMISSAATRSNLGGGAPYNMGKAAMEALALTLFRRWRT